MLQLKTFRCSGPLQVPSIILKETKLLDSKDPPVVPDVPDIILKISCPQQGPNIIMKRSKQTINPKNFVDEWLCSIYLQLF